MGNASILLFSTIVCSLLACQPGLVSDNNQGVAASATTSVVDIPSEDSIENFKASDEESLVQATSTTEADKASEAITPPIAKSTIISVPDPLEPNSANEEPVETTLSVTPISKTETEPTNSSMKTTPAPPAVVETSPIIPSHEGWDMLLRAHVSSTGQVDYPTLISKLSQLQTYLDELAANPPQKDWPAQAVKAYWINAYNAFTVKLILDNYPVKSIRDIDSGNPWGTKWIKLGDKTYSLNQIEHEILRPRFQDARIHFAVNCAAASCPPLHSRAFTAENTNSLLSRLTKSFINNSDYNTITKQKVEVSKIFDWYGEDFGKLQDYLNQYSEVTIRPDQSIVFREYDWGLNGK